MKVVVKKLCWVLNEQIQFGVPWALKEWSDFILPLCEANALGPTSIKFIQHFFYLTLGI